MLAFRLKWHLRRHRWMNTLPRHSTLYNYHTSLYIVLFLIVNKNKQMKK
jgi:hypothetical protein